MVQGKHLIIQRIAFLYVLGTRAKVNNHSLVSMINRSNLTIYI